MCAHAKGVEYHVASRYVDRSVVIVLERRSWGRRSNRSGEEVEIHLDAGNKKEEEKNQWAHEMQKE